MIAISNQYLLRLREIGHESTVVINGKPVKVHYCYYHDIAEIDIDYIEGHPEPTVDMLVKIAQQIEDELNELLEKE